MRRRLAGAIASGEDADGDARPSVDRAVAGSLSVGLAACVLLAIAPHAPTYWASLVTIASFAVVPVLWPAVRFRLDTPICPLNWALIVFFLHLVVNPLLVCFGGPFVNTLPYLPGTDSINIALLVSALAWVAFAAGCTLAPRWTPRSPRRLRQLLARPRPRIATGRLAVAFAVLGLVGLALAFRSPGALVDYFHRAGAHTGAQGEAGASGAVRSASVALRPFLAFALIVVWCEWIDRRGGRERLVWRTLAIALLVAVASVTYSYNRAALAAPLLTMLAVYGTRVVRIRLAALVAVALVALAALTLLRAYRGSNYTLGQTLTNPAARHAVLSNASVDHELQIYAAAPQYLAYLLEGTGYGAHPHYGRTLVSSVMFPVPVLGKPFRDTSSVLIFNRLIYGPRSAVADQVPPFQGELFLDFALAGIVAGYLLLGVAVVKFQRGFERARDAFETYAWQYGSIWLGFLAVGSIAFFTQIALYFFWPVLAYALLRKRPQAVAAA